MPRRRYTAAELELRGTSRRNPQRYRPRTGNPTGKGLGYCPKFLTIGQKEIWRELVRLAPEGLLTQSDVFAVELVVRLIEQSRSTVMKASETAALMQLLGRLGLTPADRAKLDIPAPKTSEVSPFDEF